MSKAPDLPQELVMAIFKLAARSCKSSCLALCRVNSVCYKMALPLLFGTLILTPDLTFDKFLSMKYNPPKAAAIGVPLGALVRNMWLEDECEMLFEIVRDVCPNLECIAMNQPTLWKLENWWSVLVKTPWERETLRVVIHDSNRLWRIIGRFTEPHPLVEVEPFSSHITHLYLAHPVPFDELNLSVFGPFTRLTHLAIAYDSSEDSDSDIYRTLDFAGVLKRVQMFVVVLDAESLNDAVRFRPWQWLQKTRDDGLNTYLAEVSVANRRNDWEEEVRGTGKSIWDRAQEYSSGFPA